MLSDGAYTSLVCHDEWESWVQEEKRLTEEYEEKEEEEKESEEEDEEKEEYVEEEGGIENMKKHNERLQE